MPVAHGQTVIVGGGYVGLFAALTLDREGYDRPMLLIDRNPRFNSTPLLYELLSGEMDLSQVGPRYEALLARRRVAFVQDSVSAIDLATRTVHLRSGLRYEYERLVLGVGSTTAYFGIEGACEHALRFRTTEDALNLARHLRGALQQASQTEDTHLRQALLTVLVVGAGPSGVELAATLGDLLPSWYAPLGGNVRELRVVLINRAPQILNGDINVGLRTQAEAALKARTIPVETVLEATVEALGPDWLRYRRHGERGLLDAATIVWTAGIATNPLVQTLPVPPALRDRHDRLVVTETLQLPALPEVFVGGDCAAEPEPLPPTAQVALQQGVGIAHNLLALAEGREPRPITVHLRGSLLKLGVGEAAANLFDRVQLTGTLGHLVREFTYLGLLPTPAHNFKATVDWLTDEVFQYFCNGTSVQPTPGK